MGRPKKLVTATDPAAFSMKTDDEWRKNMHFLRNHYFRKEDRILSYAEIVRIAVTDLTAKVEAEGGKGENASSGGA